MLTRKSTLYFSFLPLGIRRNSGACFKSTVFLRESANLFTASDFRNPFSTCFTFRPLRPIPPLDYPIFFSKFCSLNRGYSDTTRSVNESNDDEDPDDDDSDDSSGYLGARSCCNDSGLAEDVRTVMNILYAPGSTGPVMKTNLEQCCVTPSPKLVVDVLSRVRNHWEAAFTFFLWAGKQPGFAHDLRAYHSMICILGKMRKFDTAWVLIDEMRGGKAGPSLVTPQTLLIMIRRYCAVHDVGRAIDTFYAHKRFKFPIGMEEFQNLLSALCRYKNVSDAEQLVFCNKNVFPFNTKSFNIILNGWSNVIGNPREAKRIWKEMKARGVLHDTFSFACIISCYSKFNKLNEVLRLFNLMMSRDIAPDRKVYNAIIHALAKGRLVKEACNLMKTMEEKGISPNAITYNSLIMPLCKARQFDAAQEVFHEMLQRGLSPSVRTYHAFFRILRTGEEVFSLLHKMNVTGCHPTHDTYIMLIRKFCRWRQLDSVFKLWNEMCLSGLDPDRSSYIVLIHGLFLNGEPEHAYRFYQEMKEKHLIPEPNIDEMLQGWLLTKKNAEPSITKSKESGTEKVNSGNRTRVTSEKVSWQRDFLQPEIRRVVREQGFSFWKP